MSIPTEPIGSIPRPPALLEAMATRAPGDPALEAAYDAAIRDTLQQFEDTGSPVVTDGEQRKYQNFWTYSVEGLPNASPDGFRIPFAAGHARRMPRLNGKGFRYTTSADQYLEIARRYTERPVKQAVIAPSALSLMYPAQEIPDYPRQQFLDDLLDDHEQDVRGCLAMPLQQLGITDDCGFAPFSDDTSTSRAAAFAKIRSRVLGTALAAFVLESPL